MAGFTIDRQALLAAVDQISRFESQLEQSLAQVRGSVASLALAWHGDAAAQQQAAQNQWNRGAEDLRAALGQLRDVAERAYANYSGAAANNTRMWS